MRRTTMCLIALVASLFALGASAGERKSLFNGKNLDGWDVLKCEAKVDNGEILLVGGNGLVQTKGMYGDFVLEYEWKALGKEFWDSGVYFRYDSVPENKPWPRKYQVNLRKGQEGNVGKTHISKEPVKVGDWNKYKLTVKGATMQLEINGKPAWKADGLQKPSGYISLQAEVPGVLHAVPVVGGQMLSRVGGRTVSTRVTGTTPAFETVRSFPIVSGRFIDDGDLQDRSRVAVVGPLVVDELFRGESPLGETIFVLGVPFRVIGVTGSKGFSADGANEDELVIIPFTVAMGRLLNAESLNLIFVQAVSEAALPATGSSITSLLRRRHWIERDSAPAGAGADDFIVTDQAATVRAQQAAGSGRRRRA